ncbi:MAG TPA: glycosyltransferase family 4 protein [Longimicrobium sp.]|jgi:glycosyltransferase involved in cell wall biosynthesis
MRILVVSNFYPPHFIGGYELGCAAAVEALRRRGHQVAVLTSTYGGDGPRSEGEVHRWMTGVGPEPARPWRPAPVRRLATLVRLVRKERGNWAALRRLAAEFRPDVVYVWNPVGTSVSLAAALPALGKPSAFYVFDEWMARGDDLVLRFWKGGGVPARVAAAAGLPAVSGGVAFRNVHFGSAYLAEAVRAAGVRTEGARTIHWGIDPGAFPYRAERRPEVRRLLFVGQVLPHKGVHTLVEALALVAAEPGSRVTLTIAGDADNPYGHELRRRVRELGLEDAVSFRGRVPRAEIVPLYHEHDVLVFPSVWNEPFGITILEAMACGLPVVATGTGGSGEIVRDGENALVFGPGDAAACARQIGRLMRDEELFERIRRNARDSVERHFTLDRTIAEIEEGLRAAVAGGAA